MKLKAMLPDSVTVIPESLLAEMGFHRTGNFEYQRGSVWGSLLSNSVLRFKTKLIVEPNPSGSFSVTYVPVTLGNITTLNTKACWEADLETIMMSLQQGNPVQRTNPYEAICLAENRQILRMTLSMVGLGGLAGAILGAVFHNQWIGLSLLFASSVLARRAVSKKFTELEEN